MSPFLSCVRRVGLLVLYLYPAQCRTVVFNSGVHVHREVSLIIKLYPRSIPLQFAPQSIIRQSALFPLILQDPPLESDSDTFEGIRSQVMS